MSSQGPNSGSSTAGGSGLGLILWTNPGNALVSDNLYAKATAIAGGETTATLDVTGFGFSVPSGATVNGVLVEIEVHGAGTGEQTKFIKLMSSGSPIGTDLNDNASWPSPTDAYLPYGGSSNLWGATLTDTIVNSSTFGVRLQAIVGIMPGLSAVSLDHVRITVYYTTLSGPQLTQHRFATFPEEQQHYVGWLVRQCPPTYIEPPHQPPAHDFHYDEIDQFLGVEHRMRKLDTPPTYVPPVPIQSPPQSYRQDDTITDVGFRPRRFLPPSGVRTGHGGTFGVYNLIVRSGQGGTFRIENDIAGYNVYVGEDGPPDFDAAPALWSAAYPLVVPLVPPLSGTLTYHVVVRAQDIYGLESQNQLATTVTLGPSGGTVLPALPDPADLRLYAITGGTIRVLASFGPMPGDQYPPTHWRVWISTTPPDVVIDIPTAVVAVNGKVLAVNNSTYAAGTWNVAVVLFRSSDGAISSVLRGTVDVPVAPDEVVAVPSGWDEL